MICTQKIFGAGSASALWECMDHVTPKSRAVLKSQRLNGIIAYCKIMVTLSHAESQVGKTARINRTMIY